MRAVVHATAASARDQGADRRAQRQAETDQRGHGRPQQDRRPAIAVGHPGIEQDLDHPEAGAREGEDPCLVGDLQVLLAGHDDDHQGGEQGDEGRGQQSEDRHCGDGLALGVAGPRDDAREGRDEDRLREEEHRAGDECTGGIQAGVERGQLRPCDEHVEVGQGVQGDQGVRGVCSLDEVVPRPRLGTPLESLDQHEVPDNGADRRADGETEHRGVRGLSESGASNGSDHARERRQHVEDAEPRVLLEALQQAELRPGDGERDERHRHEQQPRHVIEVEDPAQQRSHRRAQGERGQPGGQDRARADLPQASAPRPRGGRWSPV